MGCNCMPVFAFVVVIPFNLFSVLRKFEKEESEVFR